MAETDTLAAPKSPVEPAPPGDHAAPAPRKSLVGLSDAFQKQIDDRAAAITEQFRPLEEARQKAEQAEQATFETRVKPALGEVEKTLRAPLPAAPKPMAHPQAPDISQRPFLTGEGKQALPNLVAALGFLAQGVMGIFGNAPNVALRGLEGAMTGWAEGDHIRAYRSWKQYLGEVDRIREDNDQAWKEWDASMKVAGTNETRALAIYTSRMAEMKQPQMALAAAERGMQSFKETLGLATQQVQAIETHTMRVEQSRFNEFLKLATLEETKARDIEAARHHRGLESIAADNQDIKRLLLAQKTEDRQQGYNTMAGVLKDMDALAERLGKKGMIPAEPGIAAATQAWTARKLAPNDEDWRQWMALQGAMVGYERQVYNDKGARALQTYKSLLDFVEHPPTQQGAHEIIKRMQGYLEAARPGGAGAKAAEAEPDFIYNPTTGKLDPVK